MSGHAHYIYIICVSIVPSAMRNALCGLIQDIHTICHMPMPVLDPLHLYLCHISPSIPSLPWTSPSLSLPLLTLSLPFPLPLSLPPSPSLSLPLPPSLSLPCLSPSLSPLQAKKVLCQSVDEYYRAKILYPDRVIQEKAAEIIRDGDVILVHAL